VLAKSARVSSQAPCLAVQLAKHEPRQREKSESQGGREQTQRPTAADRDGPPENVPAGHRRIPRIARVSFGSHLLAVDHIDAMEHERMSPRYQHDVATSHRPTQRRKQYDVGVTDRRVHTLSLATHPELTADTKRIPDEPSAVRRREAKVAFGKTLN
jgi:hypothetical protein